MRELRNSVYKFAQKIKEVKRDLLKLNIKDTKEYKDWENTYSSIYQKINVNISLFLKHIMIYLLVYLFLHKFCLNKNDNQPVLNFNYNSFNKIKTRIREYPNLQKVFTLSFFEQFLIKYFEELKIINFELLALYKKFVDSDLSPVYYFDFIIQNLFTTETRHSIGEFYTPPFLVEEMVNKGYSYGEKVLDPCCGTGNFIISIIKKILKSPKKNKIHAIDNVYGYDINPLSILITNVISFYLLKDIYKDYKPKFVVRDSLFETNGFSDFDLVIGNPPWYTYRNIEDLTRQGKIKQLADKLNIKPLPKNILNIEIASLFFYQSKELYLKDNGKVFFVITKGVLNGSHASRFRNFKGFEEIEIWSFDKKLKDIFNVDFICLYAKKSLKKGLIVNKEIPNYLFTLDGIRKNNIDYYDPINLKIFKKTFLVPFSIVKKGNKTFTQKYIIKEKKTLLLPSENSYYKKLFHKGADLNPRNLIFVEPTDYNDNLVLINPDPRVFKRAKSPWDKKEYKNVLIEKEFIFKVIKSTELIKFLSFDFYNVFLPLSKPTLNFNYEKLPPYVKKFWNEIDKIYLNNKKKTTKNKSLMDNLNRWSKLINKRQTAKIKVVYNNSGSAINAAIIRGNFLVTGDLSFFA
ncbi:MAG: N-6 DNA methylase, partial [Candidatus Lokiarchaeota archaeon]